MKLFLSTAQKLIWGVEVQLHPFLTSRLGGGEWSTCRPGRCTRGKEPWHILSRRLAGLHFAEEKDLLTLSGFESRFVHTVQ